MATRRAFLAAAPFALVPWLCGQSTRLNLAEIDRGRILAAASRALDRPLQPDPESQSAAFLAFTLDIAALAAAAQIDVGSAPRYVPRAAELLTAWLGTATPILLPAPADKSYQALLQRAALAEVAVAIPLLHMEAAALATIRPWFSQYLAYLTEDRTALLARDAKDRHGSSWLLQTVAIARLLGNEAVVSDCRHRFHTVTIRAQIDAAGLFQHELVTENPYRNSLFTLDLLAGVCLLLTTRFESPWNYELQDGPGMRAAIARHAPFIRDRAAWPYRADLTHFHELPGRRPAVLFAARAYAQPEYAAGWRTLDPDPTDPEILRAFPIRQPILWLSAPKL